MPVLPLFQTPAHPDAWHRVTAPGGCEWWHFDAEDASGRFQFVATWFEGFPLHPDYLRRYHRYRRAPTRHRPPVPGEYPCVYFALYEQGRVLAQFLAQYPPGAFSASAERARVRIGPNEFTTEGNDAIRLRVQGSACQNTWSGPRSQNDRRLSGEFEFRPVLRAPAYEWTASSSRRVLGDHRWIIANPLCDVRGTIRMDTAGAGRASANGSSGWTIEFAGRGYHDHDVGTTPLSTQFRHWVSGRVLAERSVLAFHVDRPRDAALPHEASLVEGDADGIRDVATGGCDVDWERGAAPNTTAPARMIFGDRLRLSDPRVIDLTRGCARLVYYAQFDGRTGTAYCRVIQPQRLIRPVQAQIAEIGPGAVDHRQTGPEPNDPRRAESRAYPSA